MLNVKVVQASSQSLLAALLSGGSGNLALLADEYLKGAKPVKSFDNMLWYLGSVSAQNDKKKIDFLTINGHGNSSGFRIGEDWIDLESIPKFRTQFSQLRVLLEPRGSIEIVACNSGQATELLRELSKELGGIGIIGYASNQPGGLAPQGPPVLADPKGTWSPAAPAPPTSPRTPPPPPMSPRTPPPLGK